ncbi:hypothetical protein WJX84_006869 [Apatococcus fuscideae]|uniref:Uncharacterized protein n=1 Tax=Apatococcus fuscideae TaxID=2026836 RepID=A0AAW1SZQ2_9CHLO
MRCSLLLYKGQSGDKRDLIWRRPHGRFQYQEGRGRMQDLHVSPRRDAVLRQGAMHQLEVMSLSGHQPGQVLPLEELSPGLQSAIVSMRLFGWSPCGRLVAAMATIQLSAASPAAVPAATRSSANGMQGLLQIWDTSSGTRVVSLEVLHDLLVLEGTFDLADVQARSAPQGPPRLAVLHHSSACRPYLDTNHQEVPSGKTKGCILSIELPREPTRSGAASDLAHIHNVQRRPLNLDLTITAGAETTWSKIDIRLQLGSRAFHDHASELQWSPQGSFAYMVLGSAYLLVSARHGQQLHQGGKA